ncbi:MAG: putative lipid II flippase FtsW [Clostridia bacterium]|nr:putative lipid II flippase FtsW [Clostridia bacterium]
MKYKTSFFDKSAHNINWWILISALALAIFGIIMVYSASCYSAEKQMDNGFYYAGKQIVGLVLGVVAMIFCYFVDYNFLAKLKYWALGLGILLLLIVFIPGVGIESYGAKRWIGFGSFSFQASEVAKFCLIIFCAGYMAEHSKKIQTFKGILPVLGAGGIMCVLIMLEPNMSITLCVAAVCLIMLLVGGARIKHLVMLAIPVVALIPVLILLEPYRLKRLTAFLDPWASPQGEGFQLIQSLFSLGSGGWFGTGLFESRAKYSFLPFSESDFIFSIIGEELGLVGAICVLLVFGILIFSGFKIAIKANTRFGCLLATGITSVLAVQVVLNVAVVTGLVPPTGLPLPLISAGSTSLVVFMAAVGVLLNIDRQSKKILI